MTKSSTSIADLVDVKIYDPRELTEEATDPGCRSLDELTEEAERLGLYDSDRS